MKLCIHNDGMGRCDMLGGGYCTEGPCPSEEVVEYEPVRHGRWIDMSPDACAEGMWCCSSCAEELYFTEARPDESEINYCPYCGAMMDGGEENA